MRKVDWMQELILVGGGGCMRELLWQIREQNRRGNGFKVVGIVDKVQEESKTTIDGIPVLGDDSYLLNCKKSVNVAICVGDSSLRKKIANRFLVNPNIHFPILKLSNTCIDEQAVLGKGTIISKGSTISIDAKFGEFVFVNMNTMVCHEATLGDFVTLSPSVNIAGNVTIEQESEVGIGATILPGICIGANSIVGAGAVVTKNVPNNCTVVGVPACPQSCSLKK